MRSRKNSLANNNLIEKILLQADFFLYIPQSGIYHIGARRYIVCQHIVPKAYRAPFGRGVTERNTSLHSGSIDSVQNVEASFAILKHGSEG